MKQTRLHSPFGFTMESLPIIIYLTKQLMYKIEKGLAYDFY